MAIVGRYLQEALRDANGWGWPIEIDGGIDATTAIAAVPAGVDILVAGNAIFKSADIPEAYARVKLSAELAAQESGTPRGLVRSDEGFL